MGVVILKRIRSPLLTTILVISIAIAILGIGTAPPILPSSFYGTVIVNGAFVADSAGSNVKLIS